MAQVDKVLETLLRWMLATEPEDRPDMPAVIGHDWCRKRFPRLEHEDGAHGDVKLIAVFSFK